MAKNKSAVLRSWVPGMVGVVMLVSWSFPAVADDNLIDDQTTSVATNLGLFGGKAVDIATDPTSDAVYFAAESPSGIFSSLDLGETWTGLPADTNYGAAKGVEVDPTTGTTYALIGDALLRSADQGTTWEDITTNVGITNFQEAMVFGQDRLLIAQNTGSVAVSEDGGETFSSYTIDTGVIAASLASASSGDDYYALTNRGSGAALYQTADGGQTWTDMDVTAHGIATDDSFYEITVSPIDDNHLVLITHIFTDPAYQSFDAGVTWTVIRDELSNEIHGTHATFDSSGRLYIGSSYTDDPTAASMNWETISVITPNSSIFADSFAVDAGNDDLLYTNSSYGVARSEDGGATWTDVVDGVTSVKVYDVTQADDKDVVWIGANGGLAKTENFTDSSPTWEYPILPTGGIANIKAVWVKPDDAQTVVMGGGTFFYYSTDGGETWSQSTSPEFAGNVQDIIQSRLDDNTLYAIFTDEDLSATNTGGVFMSVDAGQTWTDLSLTGSLPAVSLAVAADDTVYVGIGGDVTTRGVYQYDGTSWTALTTAPQTAVIASVLADTSDANLIYLTTTDDGSGGELYISTDAGATWSGVDTGLEDIRNLDTLTAQPSTSNIYVSGQGSSLDGVVYKSTDLGNSWSLFYTGLKQENFYTMLFDGLLLGNDRGLYGIQSKAKLKVRASDEKIQTGETITVSGTLKDAATGKLLPNKKVKVYKKVGKNGEWTRIKTKRTNDQGKVQLEVTPEKNTRYKMSWVPSGSAADEYISVTSSVVQVTLD